MTMSGKRVSGSDDDIEITDETQEQATAGGDKQVQGGGDTRVQGGGDTRVQGGGDTRDI